MTGTEYRLRLLSFESFIKEENSFNVDDLIITKVIKVDVYDLLSNYIHCLVTEDYRSSDIIVTCCPDDTTDDSDT